MSKVEYQKSPGYKIYVADEEGAMTVAVCEKGIEKTFECSYGARQYAKRSGLRAGYEIR